ncbi:sel1 repeat family protein [Streptomyces microflavus]|uniref:sel1 repeat family protein n=1 Tax=Streptomyces microflavus TaxID=1919 RepID=UPI00192AA680|nr:sel1 repeat family protein [Streptomyces microflavus]QQZ54536.1 sel1 repeat family protein [Streptomyces microflavus]
MGVGGEREASGDAAVGVGNSVSGGAFHAPVVQAGAVSGGVHTYYAQPHFSVLPPVSEWPRLDTADPIALGVRRTRRLPGESPLPPYVERDCDRELDARIRVAAQEGGLVVVTKAPLSGKTRTAWAALSANLPGSTRVFAPPPETDLRGLSALLRTWSREDCVLWLDDLEGHLGEHGLTPTVLAGLAQLGVPVVATMEDEAYDARRFGASARSGVLSGVQPVELRWAWSTNEIWRLGGQTEEPRLRDALLGHGRRTVPEYLAVGPELIEEWRRARRPDAHPRGHLLVRAAIDLVRCGVPMVDIRGGAVLRAQELYPGELAAAEAESVEDGVAWAVGIRHSVAGLLAPGRDKGAWAVHGSLVADVEGRGDSPPVPLGMWPLALHYAPAARVSQQRWRIARRASQALGSQAEGNPEILTLLGRVHAEAGNSAAAELSYRKAAEAGGTEAAVTLGELLVLREAEAEALPYLEQAAGAGIVRAQYLLGMLLANQAQSWLTRAADAGHPAAAEALPPLRKVTATPPDTVRE